MDGHYVCFLPLFVFLLLHLMGMMVHGASTEGFISIDCGSPPYLKYHIREMPYESDGPFIDAGEVHKLSENFRGYERPFNYLRSFPDDGGRYCYKIGPVVKGQKYLVRARFNYGQNKWPELRLYLGILFCRLIEHYVSEIMTVASSSSFSVCLVGMGQGRPFISAIEVRPLPSDIYPQVGASHASILWYRESARAAVNKYRYPTDKHDRFWNWPMAKWTMANGGGGNWTILNATAPVRPSTGDNDVPVDVMKSAITPENDSSIERSFPGFPEYQNTTGTQLYLILYFAELTRLAANESRIFKVFLNDEVISEDIRPKYLQTSNFSRLVPARDVQSEIRVRITKSNGSSLPPIVNAIELYWLVDNSYPSETETKDVDAIAAIKRTYRLRKNWMGDPCAPQKYMWDGLKCSSASGNPRIVSLNLSSENLKGEISASLVNLTELQSLNLSNNKLIGEIPSFLANLSQLKVLDLSRNNLNGIVPRALFKRSKNGSLTLRVEENPRLCETDKSCNKSTRKYLIVIPSLIGLVIIVPFALGTIILKLRKKKVTTIPSPRETIRFKYDRIVEITNSFKRQIGRGGFGSVFHGVYGNSVQVAVKMLSSSSSQGSKEFLTEIELLSRIHHRNLVSLIGYCNDGDHQALVYEYMEGGSLENYLSGKVGNMRTLSWSERLRIAKETSQGLEYLHKGCKPAIIHRDVKPSNILLTQNKEVKVTDFGMSKIFQTDSNNHMSTGVVGTLGYLDPKYYTSNQLTEKSDVYSFGVVLLELITGQPAIIKTEENTFIADWVRPRLERAEMRDVLDRRIEEGSYDLDCTWKAVEIAMACIEYDNSKRPTMTEVVAQLNECLELEKACQRAQSSSPCAEEHAMARMAPDSDSSMMHPKAR